MNCETCPTRLLAEQLEALAMSEEAAEARHRELLADRAEHSRTEPGADPPLSERLRTRSAEVRNMPCGWWWGVEEHFEIDGKPTGQTRVVQRCGRQYLVEYFNQTSAIAQGCQKATESHRNVVAEGFSALVGQPIGGDGRSLPEHVREVLAAEGLLTKTVGPDGREWPDRSQVMLTKGEMPNAAESA